MHRYINTLFNKNTNIINSGFTFSLGSGLLLIGALLIFRNQYLQLMTPNPHIQKLAISILPYLSISSMLQQIAAIIDGLLSGSGEQKELLILIHLYILYFCHCLDIYSHFMLI